jgi:hypothetical protein
VRKQGPVSRAAINEDSFAGRPEPSSHAGPALCYC